MTNTAAPSEETNHSSSASALDADLVFRPLAVAGGFMYQVRHGMRLPRDVPERLAAIGMLRRVFSERVNTCPECGSGNILFREVCPHCEGADTGSAMRRIPERLRVDADYVARSPWDVCHGHLRGTTRHIRVRKTQCPMVQAGFR